MLPAIEVERLCKDYGRLRAVDGVSFQVARGEVYALLGPNGAGKTTTVEILEGHRARTSGSARVLGTDPTIGGCGQHPAAPHPPPAAAPQPPDHQPR